MSLKPSVTKRCSPEASGSSRVRAKSSEKTVEASAKLTPCAARFAAALAGSHSYRTRSVYGQMSSGSNLAETGGPDFLGWMPPPSSGGFSPLPRGREAAFGEPRHPVPASQLLGSLSERCDKGGIGFNQHLADLFSESMHPGGE